MHYLGIMMISPQHVTIRARSYHWSPKKFCVTNKVLLGLIAGFVLWQKTGMTDYFTNLAAEFLIPNLDAPAVQYAVMGFVVVLGFSVWMSLMVVMVFFITSVSRLLLSRFFFVSTGNTWNSLVTAQK